jgi:hypothetical protein
MKRVKTPEKRYHFILCPFLSQALNLIGYRAGGIPLITEESEEDL